MLTISVPMPRFALPMACYQRAIRPGQAVRYEVKSQWDSNNGKATYAYRMTLSTEKPKEKKTAYLVVAKLTDLDAEFDGTPNHKDDFGVIPFVLTESGGPARMGAGGTITTFAVPLLSLTLPSELPNERGQYAIPPFDIVDLGSVSGRGALTGAAHRTLHLTSDLKVG